MFRKLILATAATAAIGAAALAPTSASAGGFHHHGHWHGGFGVWGGPTIVVGSDCYYVDKVVYTSHGKRIRRVEVCD